MSKKYKTFPYVVNFEAFHLHTAKENINLLSVYSKNAWLLSMLLVVFAAIFSKRSSNLFIQNKSLSFVALGATGKLEKSMMLFWNQPLAAKYLQAIFFSGDVPGTSL